MSQVVDHEPQVLVIGAGSAGVAAAVAAAESGARTTLIESTGHVGGTLARQLLEHSAGFHDIAGNQVTGGVGQRLVSLLQQYGGSPGHIPDDVHYTATRTPVNHAELSMCQGILLHQAGVRLLLNAAVVGAEETDDHLSRIDVDVAGHGRMTFSPDVVVDTSGDAVVFALAGAAMQTDLQARQPASLLLKLGGVDYGPIFDYMAAHPDDFRDGSRIGSADDDIANLWGFGQLLARGHQEGRLSWKRTEMHLAAWPTRGEAVLNITRLRLPAEASDPGSVYPGLAQQVMETVSWFRDYVPGGRNAYLADVADRVGVRESRRIQGNDTLTAASVTSGRTSPTSIGQGAFPIDIHDADKPGLSHTDQLSRGYDIPYGVLVARGQDNLLAGGRCVSSTHEANGSVRITATCFVTGEAAGVAAALAATTGVDARTLDISILQAKLRQRGVIGAR